MEEVFEYEAALARENNAHTSVEKYTGNYTKAASRKRCQTNKEKDEAQKEN